MTFTIIDAAIIFIYLMGMLVLGFIMGKTNKTQEDYFVGKAFIAMAANRTVHCGHHD